MPNGIKHLYDEPIAVGVKLTRECLTGIFLLSEWRMTPRGRLRRHKAIRRASQVSFTVIRSDMAQPMTLRA